MGAQGSTIVDFGSFPGSSHATVNVTGQSAIQSGSMVEAWVYPLATADHSADEHMLEPIKVCARDIVAGTGFTIHALNANTINEPLVPLTPSAFRSAAGSIYGHTEPSSGGKGTRLYGQFTIGWVWA